MKLAPVTHPALLPLLEYGQARKRDTQVPLLDWRQQRDALVWQALVDAGFHPSLHPYIALYYRDDSAVSTTVFCVFKYHSACLAPLVCGFRLLHNGVVYFDLDPIRPRFPFLVAAPRVTIDNEGYQVVRWAKDRDPYYSCTDLPAALVVARETMRSFNELLEDADWHNSNPDMREATE